MNNEFLDRPATRGVYAERRSRIEGLRDASRRAEEHPENARNLREAVLFCPGDKGIPYGPDVFHRYANGWAQI
jgi:hypothetical protein